MSKRLRMFAGPNGSGKSTVKSVVPSAFLGVYLNPDEIEIEVKRNDYYELRGLNLSVTTEEVNQFFDAHPLMERASELDYFGSIKVANDGEFISFADAPFNSYLSAILTDFLRQELIQAGRSFTFETVMSSADKLNTLQTAQQEGFRTYLYYVATESPQINITRIQHRVRAGGHAVPTNKVIERYHRSLGLLLDAIRLTNRAYVFDNSGTSRRWVAEITNGVDIQLHTNAVPNWFREAVLEKL